jgi:dihydroorotate dehydrogenase electron transfer subunit
MQQGIFEIASNRRLAEDIYEMRLSGFTGSGCLPGQFINIKLDGFFLRRPISVCDCTPGNITIIYKLLGRGTAKMSELCPGTRLDVLTGLGNGYDIDKAGERPLLVGGGVGLPPMYLLAKRLIEAGRKVSVAAGFASKSGVFYEEQFKRLGAGVYIATADGSYGVRGLVTDAMAQCPDFDSVCACGPEAMLRAVYDFADVPGQFSFEERMGCGFGACMGCSCETKYGSKRICRDGPVLFREEIIW